MNMKQFLIISLLFTFVIGCVPSKKYRELLEQQKECNEELEKYKTRALDAEDALKNSDVKLKQANKQLDKTNKELDRLDKKYKKLNEEYELLQELNKTIENKLASSKKLGKEETSTLNAELEATRIELQKKEDYLNQLEKELNAKERELQQREERVNELEQMIAAKDNALQKLKDRVANALLGFEGKGLTVEEKNGKIYVSMEAKLLFKSGSTKVDEDGEQAIIDLAKVLQDQEGLEIIVEGHTDTDPIKSSKHPTDNWELSVLRATSVVKIMTSNSDIDEKVLSASGRSEYHPVDPSDKSKNRRIEIIISPNLDELFEIINQ